MTNKETLREVEAVAEQCHLQWAGWTDYLLSKMEPWWHDKEYLLMNRVWKDRWQKQINTPYPALSETEKESDRKEARKILAVLPLADRLAAQAQEIKTLAPAPEKPCPGHDHDGPCVDGICDSGRYPRYCIRGIHQKPCPKAKPEPAALDKENR